MSKQKPRAAATSLATGSESAVDDQLRMRLFVREEQHREKRVEERVLAGLKATAGTDYINRG